MSAKRSWNMAHCIPAFLALRCGGRRGKPPHSGRGRRSALPASRRRGHVLEMSEIWSASCCAARGRAFSVGEGDREWFSTRSGLSIRLCPRPHPFGWQVVHFLEDRGIGRRTAKMPSPEPLAVFRFRSTCCLDHVESANNRGVV